MFISKLKKLSHYFIKWSASSQCEPVGKALGTGPLKQNCSKTKHFVGCRLEKIERYLPN